MLYLNLSQFTKMDQISNAENSTVKTINTSLVGATYIFISTTYILAYILCLFIMYTDKVMSTTPIYRIIIHMGYSDLLQLLFNGIPAGVYSILGDDRPFILNKILGAIVDAGWFSYIFLSQVLAINRFLYIYMEHRVADFFSEGLTNLYISCCWLIGLGFLIALCLPGVDFHYSVKISSYLYGTSTASLIMIRVNLYIDIFHTISLITLYVLIYVKVHLKVKQIKIPLCRSREKDRKLLLQAFLLCFSDVVTVIAYMTLQHVPSIGSIFPIFINYTWIVCAGNNVVVYVILNDTVKARLRLILYKRQLFPIVVTSSAADCISLAKRDMLSKIERQKVKRPNTR